MTDSQNSRNAENEPAVRDPGHTRAREISTARNAAKTRGGGRTAEDTRSGPAAGGETRSSTGSRSSGARSGSKSGSGSGDTERLRRRARFLRERNEAQELRDRVQPRRARSARMRQAMRMRTFRW